MIGKKNMATPFTWKNCHADIYTGAHGATAWSFFDDVIVPSTDLLEDKIATLGGSDDAVSEFAKVDTQSVLQETKKAFGISLQSIWERQLRGYLSSCAKELEPISNLGAKVEKANWHALCELFESLRGIQLQDFPDYWELDTLQHLGNACRHGNGNSANEVMKRCPEFWQVCPKVPFPIAQSEAIIAQVEVMNVSVDRLSKFAGAIAGFWDDVRYINTESISTKSSYLEKVLAQERRERSWLPVARSTSTDAK